MIKGTGKNIRTWDGNDNVRVIEREFPSERPAPPPRPAPPRPPPPAPPPVRPAPPPPMREEVPNYKPQPWTPPVTDADIVNEIADCLNKPPTDIEQNYILRSMHTAEYLKVPASTETSTQLSLNSDDLKRLFTTKNTTARPRPPPPNSTKDLELRGVVKPTTNTNYSVTQPVVWVANEL